MTQYLEIAIDLTELGNGSFEIKARSPAGQASAPFKPPFTLADIGPMLVVGGLRRGAVASDGDETRAAVGSRGDIGVSLYQSLFQGAIAGILARTEGLAANRSDGGIRIRMNFNLLEGGTAAVAALPWELMRKPDETDPLLVSTQTVLVRSLDVNKVVTPRPMTGPLRVLLIRANPKGTAALDLSREGELIGRSLAELPSVMVDEVDPVEDKIFSQLANAAYHVVHYMGHGDFAATKGGMLLLEDNAGNAVPTSAKAFAHLLRDEPLRLVFLNACDTGTTPQTDGLHPFAGVAAALVANGVPAVVAMQFPITDRAALTFSKVFYERIAAGDAVDVAVAQGRSALYLAAIRAGGDDDAGEWATPVLYMRAEDGAVLGTGRAATAPAIPSAAHPQVEMAENSGRPGFWKRQSGLTWGLLGAVIAIVALFAVLLLSPDPASTTPPASATAPAPQTVVAAPVGPPPADGPASIAERKGQLLTPVPPAVLAIAIESIDAIPAEAWVDDAPRGSDRTVADSEVFVHFIDRFTNRLLMQEGAVFEDLNALFSAVIAGAKPDTAAKSAYLLAMCIDSEQCKAFVWDLRSEYLTKAADGGVPVAMAALAEAYLRGDELLTQSLPIAESWLGKARAKCNSWAFPDVPQFSLQRHPLGTACPRAAPR
jgi:hypothetical protein